MEKDKVLDLMASYDFKAPISVTVLIDEDETIHGGKTDEAKTVITSEDVEVLKNDIARENSLTTTKTNGYKSNNEVNKEDITNQIRYHDNKQRKENLNKRKSPLDSENSEGKSDNKINCKNKELKVTLEKDDDKKDTDDKNVKPDKFNELNPIIKDMLKIISQHLIFITEAYLCSQLSKNTSKESESQKYFFRIKTHLFSLSYSTVLTVLLPQENNRNFIKDFLETTITLANETKSIQIPFNQLEILLFEMLKWAKRRKESLENIPFSYLTSKPNNNCHDSSLTNHSSSLTRNSLPSQSFMPNTRQLQNTNLIRSETTRHFESTTYYNPPVENVRGKNIAPSVSYNYIKSLQNMSPMPANNHLSTRQPENAYLISQRVSCPSENTESFLRTNTIAKLPTTTLPSSNTITLLKNKNINSQVTPNMTIMPSLSSNLTSMPPRNMAPIFQKGHSALVDILTSSDPRNSTLTSQTNIAPVPSRRVSEVLPNTCIFAAGPPGKEITIHMPSNSMLTGTNKNYSPPNNVNPTTKGYHLPHCPPNNGGCNNFSLGYYGQNISDASRTNYRSTTSLNFQPDNSQSNILTVPYLSRCDIPLATSQNNLEEQLLRHNLNNQMEAQIESRRSISTDSGFISPLHFIPAEQAITTSCVQDKEVPGDMPLITNVTSLHPNVSDEKICRVCRKKTQKMCLGCYKYYYCSDECQRTDWTYHMKICKRN